MLRQNNPLSFGELNKASSEVNDKEILNNICATIFKFYHENMGDTSNINTDDYKNAKKCLRSIFKSIQKVPKEKEKKKKLPNKKRSNFLEAKSSSKKISSSKKDNSMILPFSQDDTKPIKSFFR